MSPDRIGGPTADVMFNDHPNNEIDGGEGDDVIFGVGIEKEMVIRGGPGNDLVYAGGNKNDDDYGDITNDGSFDGEIFLYGDDGHDKIYGADYIPF